MNALPTIEVVSEPERVLALVPPVRRQILVALQCPASAASVARQLGLPRQQVNYHLRELEDRALVRFVEERKARNCTERLVVATAQSYLISPDALGMLGPEPERVRDRFSLSYLIACAARAIRDAAALRRRSDTTGKPVAALTTQARVRFASTDDRNAFTEDLLAETTRLAREYHDENAPDGRDYEVLVLSYPAITKPDGDVHAATLSDGPG